MKTSQNGINLIKQFEGCRLSAYKPVSTEEYYTIGYGHYGADVKAGMKITQAQADAFLVADLAKFERAVNKVGLSINQNQYDALVSFAYNCGAGNLRKLVTGRTILQIADALLAYNKGGGKVLTGLTRRRQAERALFLSGTKTNVCPYPEPTRSVKYGSRGDTVRWVQWMLKNVGGFSKLNIDGSAGQNTVSAIRQFQTNTGLDPDGVCGKNTREMFKKML